MTFSFQTTSALYIMLDNNKGNENYDYFMSSTGAEDFNHRKVSLDIISVCTINRIKISSFFNQQACTIQLFMNKNKTKNKRYSSPPSLLP